MAASTAAYGARAGLETFVLLKEGTAETSLKAAGIYSPRLIAVDGDYGSLFRASLEIGRRLGISFMNSIDPYRMEGYKLTAFEIYLQMGRHSPRFLIVPVSSGGHLLGLMRAFEDLEREKLITTYPTFVGVQARGCAPLAAAFAAGLERYERPKSGRSPTPSPTQPLLPGMPFFA
jgi:threonine synthase